MVKLNKIYTRTGDLGETGLVDGSRISKDHPRAQAIGDVDELNSAIGVALVHIEGEPRLMLGRVQNELFDLGADLATPGEDFTPSDMVLRIVQVQIDRHEAEIDAMNEQIEPLYRPIRRLLPDFGGIDFSPLIVLLLLGVLQILLDGAEASLTQPTI